MIKPRGLFVCEVSFSWRILTWEVMDVHWWYRWKVHRGIFKVVVGWMKKHLADHVSCSNDVMRTQL
jgi:hypothetical protein